MKKMRPHKKGFEPVVGVGYSLASSPTFRDRVQVVRLWSDLWGARLFAAVRARAREGRVKSRRPNGSRPRP